MKATEILKQASDCIGDRASERDQEQERSMARTVKTFNALTGHNLSEKEGWYFMAILKMARSMQGAEKIDDYIDGAAYIALAGELVKDKPIIKLFGEDPEEIYHMTEAPELGYIYYYINRDGKECSTLWDGDIIDALRLMRCNVFETNEHMNRELERRKAKK